MVFFMEGTPWGSDWGMSEELSPLGPGVERSFNLKVMELSKDFGGRGDSGSCAFYVGPSKKGSSGGQDVSCIVMVLRDDKDNVECKEQEYLGGKMRNVVLFSLWT